MRALRRPPVALRGTHLPRLLSCEGGETTSSQGATVRRIYDTLTPHCAAAIAYRSRLATRINGKRRIIEETRYRCEHVEPRGEHREARTRRPPKAAIAGRGRRHD